jgi:hypothetical protein
MPGLRYRFQYKEGLLDAEWLPWGDEFNAAEATAVLTDDAPPGVHRFYRILYLPNP